MANFTRFTTFPIKVAQNDSEWPISPDLQLFQSFPTEVATEVAQNDLEWPILPDLQLFQSFPIKVAWNGQFHLIHNFSNLFPPKWLRMTWNGQFCPICNFSNLFPLAQVAQNDSEWPISPDLHFSNLFPSGSKSAQNDSNLFPSNGQFHPIHNFSNLFPPKWLRMTWNGQFDLQLFQSFPTEVAQNDNGFSRFATLTIFSHRSGSK